MDEALGLNADQHRQGWDEVYPDAERMPEQLTNEIGAVSQTLINLKLARQNLAQ